MQRPPAAELFVEDTEFPMEFGPALPRLEIAWESWGPESAEEIILLFPAFSAHCHAKSSPRDPESGWWEAMLGSGAAIDTDRFRVISASLLGGCHGTLGPKSIDPRTGQPFRGDFPVVSLRDIARAQGHLIKGLGIDKLHATIGGSMGAMQALEFALLFPELSHKTIAFSGTAYTRPATAAIRHLGRKSIMADPAYRGGHYEDEGPLNGIRLARELGTVFYRSKDEFNARFDHAPINPPTLDGLTFDVQSYLSHQGLKATTKFDANAYIRLSLAMDLHDLARGRGALEEAFASIAKSRFLIGGVPEDRLIPMPEQEEIRRALVESGHDVSWFEVSSPVGHDAFLVDFDSFGRAIKPYIESD